ncbi:MAG: hypothetical protein CXZ00_11230 [Acidobacteria bacterium]|nr:MAG: hypothetical protein CXZ00_11230 [Acidobacteriota bacterium]
MADHACKLPVVAPASLLWLSAHMLQLCLGYPLASRAAFRTDNVNEIEAISSKTGHTPDVLTTFDWGGNLVIQSSHQFDSMCDGLKLLIAGAAQPRLQCQFWRRATRLADVGASSVINDECVTGIPVFHFDLLWRSRKPVLHL